MDRRVTDRSWWHVIDLPGGEATPGGWDLRPTTKELPWPDLRGKRCLDVGTADGFWAFEMERRGAADVLAIDIPSAFQERSRANFELAHELLGSSVRYEPRDLFDVEGEFDLVFMGFMLQFLRDPIGGLEAARRVSRGHLLLLDTVSLPLAFLPAPLARLDARKLTGAFELFVFNPRGMRKAVELAGWTVEAQTGILQDHPGPTASPTWRHRVGILGRSSALRASI
jgi:tRNA (mo5U34)-methyltransferase